MDTAIKQLMEKLQEPFLPDEIEWRVGSTNADKSKGMALAYVTNRAIQNRLDELFGPFGWRNEFKEWKGNGQLCGISVKFGDEWITKWDGADDSNMEATKGGLSDAMKRAGYQWGIGRYLYKLDSTWEPIKPAGKSYALVSEPKLPAWALPEGFKYGAQPKQQPAKLTEAPKAQPSATPVQQPNKAPITPAPQGEHFLQTFWRQTRDLGYKQPEVIDFAKKNGATSLSSCNEEQIKTLYQQLVDFKLHMENKGA